MFKFISLSTVAAFISCAVAPGNTAVAEPLALANTTHQASAIFEQVMRGQPAVQGPGEDTQVAAELPARLRRQIVDFPTSEASGTIIIDTPNTYLYYVLGAGKAIRYGIGVGREGFTWSGVQNIARKAEWPDWIPPAEMVARQPYLPRFMAGGLGNPLGARALYLGGTIYRIHGTNQPSTIGGQVSSGCIRMVNEDVVDLYGRVDVGTKVVVLPAESHRIPDRSAQNPIRRDDRVVCLESLTGFRGPLTLLETTGVDASTRGTLMNHSLFTCDRATHLKIVAVALAAGIVVVLAGIHARMDDAGNALASVKTVGPVVKAGRPAVYSTRNNSAIR